MERPILLGAVFDTWEVLKLGLGRGILGGAIPVLLGMWAGRLAGAGLGADGVSLGPRRDAATFGRGKSG